VLVLLRTRCLHMQVQARTLRRGCRHASMSMHTGTHNTHSMQGTQAPDTHNQLVQLVCRALLRPPLIQPLQEVYEPDADRIARHLCAAAAARPHGPWPWWLISFSHTASWDYKRQAPHRCKGPRTDFLNAWTARHHKSVNIELYTARPRDTHTLSSAPLHRAERPPERGSSPHPRSVCCARGRLIAALPQQPPPPTLSCPDSGCCCSAAAAAIAAATEEAAAAAVRAAAVGRTGPAGSTSRN